MISLTEARERLLEQHREELETINEAIRLCGVLEGRNGAATVKTPSDLPAESAPALVKVRADKRKNPRKATAKPREDTLRIASVAAGMDGISAPSLAKEAGIDLKKASNFIMHAKLRGWVKQVGFGKYQATAKMPRQNESTDAPESVASPLTHREPSQQVRHLEEELARTEKELVHAIEHDQETLKTILKDKVKVLEAKLAAARKSNA